MLGGGEHHRSAFRTAVTTGDDLLPIDTRLLPDAFITAFGMPESTFEATGTHSVPAGNAFRSPYTLMVRPAMRP